MELDGLHTDPSVVDSQPVPVLVHNDPLQPFIDQPDPAGEVPPDHDLSGETGKETEDGTAPSRESTEKNKHIYR